MNTTVQIFVLSLLIFGVFGGFENTCGDKEAYCVKDERLCLNPDYYFECSKTCGCKNSTTCLDRDAGCLKQSAICLKEDKRRRCPRFCGVCEGCENLVHDDICQKYSNRCNDYNVRYLCAQTCGKCNESCRNKMASDRICNAFHKNGYCDSGSQFHSIMMEVCEASCTSGECTYTS